MVFVVFIGLNDIDNPASSDEQGKKVALLLSDTVLVQKVFRREIVDKNLENCRMAWIY
jgi:hypothetical protein